MDKIKTQADKLWQLISNPSTVAAYRQALTLTWAILKETGLLLWLVICLVLVLGDWFWKYSYQAGQNTRTWLDELQTKSTSEAESSGNFWSETGKSLLAAGQSTVDAALNTARDQLGIEAPPAPAPKALSPAPEPAKPAHIPPAPVEIPPAEADELLNEPKVPAVESTPSEGAKDQDPV
ncbi:MAG: hypothetical protein NW224_17870 [Leptolyngbyaceae cyanobacterium bins.302]|nr:hypothetical protein [Leptolyngbyaceae cyanobacterium bins.302]